MSDDEALIIVTESNANQRATFDMLPSELAKALKMQLNAYKRLKRQSKYVENVENWLDPVPENGFGENVGIQHLKKSRDVVARGNGIGVFKARSYLRLNFPSTPTSAKLLTVDAIYFSSIFSSISISIPIWTEEPSTNL